MDIDYDTQKASPDGTDNSVEEPTVTPDVNADEPDYEARFREANERNAELRSELEKAQSAAEARLTQMEGLLGAAFNRPASAQAQPEPDISDDEFFQNPKGASRKMAQLEAARLVQQSNEANARAYRALAERAFTAEYQSVAARNPEVFGQVREQVDEYFQKNPDAKMAPGAAQDAYEYFAGKALLAGTLQLEKPEEPVKTKPVPATAPSTTPPSPTGPRQSEPERKLNDAQRRVADIWGLSDEEWFAVEDNPEFYSKPKGGR